MILKNIIDILIKRKLSFLNEKSNSHTGNAFAHGMGDMPNPAAIRIKISLTDDFSVAQDHKMVHICIMGSV